MPGINAPPVDGSLLPEEFEQMSSWMPRHIIRTPKAREQLFQSAADYARRFHNELLKEQLFSAYFRYAYIIHAVTEPNFVVTSGNSVIEFACAGFLMRACALSPQKRAIRSPPSLVMTISVARC